MPSELKLNYSSSRGLAAGSEMGASLAMATTAVMNMRPMIKILAMAEMT